MKIYCEHPDKCCDTLGMSMDLDTMTEAEKAANIAAEKKAIKDYQMMVWGIKIFLAVLILVGAVIGVYVGITEYPNLPDGVDMTLPGHIFMMVFLCEAVILGGAMCVGATLAFAAACHYS